VTNNRRARLFCQTAPPSTILALVAGSCRQSVSLILVGRTERMRRGRDSLSAREPSPPSSRTARAQASRNPGSSYFLSLAFCFAQRFF
jgi:hypothetical protein